MKLRDVNDIIYRLKNDSMSVKKREELWEILLYEHPFLYNILKIDEDNADDPRKFFRIQRGLHNSISRMLPLKSGDTRLNVGRANYPLESVLYCTDKDFFSCFLELVDRTHEEFQFITVIEFQNKASLKTYPIGVVDRKRYTKALNKYSYMSPAEFESYTVISEFMDQEFRLISEVEDRSYLNSSVISKLLREVFVDSHGISYKTVRSFNFHHFGLNYAFSIKNFEEFFEITNCMQRKFRWIEKETYQIKDEIVNIGIKVNNEETMVFEDDWLLKIKTTAESILKRELSDNECDEITSKNGYLSKQLLDGIISSSIASELINFLN